MFKYINNYEAKLTTGIAAADTSMTVTVPITLGVGEVCRLTLQNEDASLFEIVDVTAVTGSVCTIERAKEGTTARVWTVNDIVVCSITAAQAKVMQNESWFNTVVPSIDIANGQLQQLTLGATGTLSITMQNNQAMTLLIKPSSFALTMPTIKWFGKSFVLVANKEHLLTIFKKDDLLRGTWSREV